MTLTSLMWHQSSAVDPVRLLDRVLPAEQCRYHPDTGARLEHPWNWEQER